MKLLKLEKDLILSSTEQIMYLLFLNHTNTYIDSGVLESCDNCSSTEIEFPDNLPFGGYFHQSAYVYSEILYIYSYILLKWPFCRWKQMDISPLDKDFPTQFLNCFHLHHQMSFGATYLLHSGLIFKQLCKEGCHGRFLTLLIHQKYLIK